MLKFKISGVLFLLLIFCFCFVAQASAQTSLDTLKPADRREIIKLLLENVSKNSKEKIIYVSVKNLSPEVQSDLSGIANEQVQLIPSAEQAVRNGCEYQFGAVNASNKLVSISFGNCKAGLAYNFKKVRGKWKSVPHVIEK